MFKSGSKLYLLIGINVFVFLLFGVLSVLEKLTLRTNYVTAYTYEYLAMPAYLPKLLVRFWTPLSYMFMHADFWHVLFNMMWLFWIGQIFEEFLGNKRILGLYLLGGLAGAVVFIAGYNLFPLLSNSTVLLTSNVVGASACVMAVTAGAATIAPNYAIMLFGVIPVKLKWIAIIYAVLGFLGMVGSNAGGQMAHLGGLIFGFIYVKQLQKGRDVVAAIAGLFKPKSKLKVASTNRDKVSNNTPRQDEIDHILDKISTTGYDNLSKQEKETLFRASKK
ncbi:rhomboid family intramembrane serine protease [Mucilaginibacter antarcticus]|uniref:Rhomboid family intramembrane serine protease n=1 Tax=Mucilaginibacter antarcticus TaxID=1855725 RepID=A0ABW5XRZ7_9SPHI